jgi:hypothetical protein
LGVCDTPPHRPSPGLLEGGGGEFCFISTFKTCSSISLCTYTILCRGKQDTAVFNSVVHFECKEAPEYWRPITITSLYGNTVRTNPTIRRYVICATVSVTSKPRINRQKWTRWAGHIAHMGDIKILKKFQSVNRRYASTWKTQK